MRKNKLTQCKIMCYEIKIEDHMSQNAYIAVHTTTPELTELYNQLNKQYYTLAVSTHDDLVEQRDKPSPTLSGGYESISSSSCETLANALARRVLEPTAMILISNNPAMIAAAAQLNISTISIAPSDGRFTDAQGTGTDIKEAQILLGEWASNAHRRSTAHPKLEAV